MGLSVMVIFIPVGSSLREKLNPSSPQQIPKEQYALSMVDKLQHEFFNLLL